MAWVGEFHGRLEVDELARRRDPRSSTLYPNSKKDMTSHPGEVESMIFERTRICSLYLELTDLWWGPWTSMTAP